MKTFSNFQRYKFTIQQQDSMKKNIEKLLFLLCCMFIAPCSIKKIVMMLENCIRKPAVLAIKVKAPAHEKKNVEE